MSPMKYLAPVLVALLCGACASTWHPYRFLPAPLEVQVGVEGDPSMQARTLLTIRGIRRASEGRGASVEVRLRLENLGSEPAVLDLADLGLVAADLESFGTPVVSPSHAEPVAQGDHSLHDLSFPLPDGREVGDLDLSGINLRWSVVFADVRVTMGATFERRSSLGGTLKWSR